jgi:hypothetical protein
MGNGKGKIMKTRLCKKISLGWLLALTAFLGSSCIYIGDYGEMARFEKEVPLSAPMQPGSSFSAETGDGSIRIDGLETSECRVLATVVTHARTQQQADELAQQIDVRLEPAGDGLKVVIDRPPVIRNAHFGVSLDVDLPVQSHLALVTSNGGVRVTNITGNVDARTSDGSIETERVNGDIRLKTSDGGITLTNVRGDSLNLHTNDGTIRCHGVVAAQVDCRTSDGSVEIEFSPDAPKALNVNATTSDGSITLTAPPELSTVVEANTSDGSIHTSLPITIQGKVGKSLQGTIGAGEGRIYLRTSDGSITIR